MEKIITIANALFTELTGAVDEELSTIGTIEPKEDPAGNLYYGCDFSIKITEFLN